MKMSMAVVRLYTATTKINARGNTFTCVPLQNLHAWAVTDYLCRLIRGVFNGRSKHAFVTEALSGCLKLKCLSSIIVAIITYANVSSCTPKRLRIVALHLWHQLSNVEVALRAIEIPHICQDFFGQHDDFSVHRGIKKTGHNIADELLHALIEKESWISVLTGWDQMWEMMNKWNLHI